MLQSFLRLLKQAQKGLYTKQGKTPLSGSGQESGILVFAHTAEVIRAENVLVQAGIAVKVMGPPPDLHTGCDMILVFPLLLEPLVRATLEQASLQPLLVRSQAEALLEPVSLFHSKWLDHFLMVRAANMKISVDATSGRIVNISGGGCPDVPYLATLLTGTLLAEAEEPKARGKTLCSYSLQKAFEEARRLMSLPHEETYGRIPEEEEPTFSSWTALPPPAEAACPWLVCGIVPDESFPLLLGQWTIQGDCLVLEPNDISVPIQRGTPALLASALTINAALGSSSVHALLVGDNGSGDGSRRLYAHLAQLLAGDFPWKGITFHYLFPDLDGHNKIVSVLEQMDPDVRPFLVADAGYMYVAKMSGYAFMYDIFTPDAGELAFLADAKAPHPFYTRGYLLGREEDAPALAREAWEGGNSSTRLLIKGPTDYVVGHGTVWANIQDPLVPAMEAIGGTGDLVTGILTALLAAGYEASQACVLAASLNRMAGAAAHPSPATTVAELIPHLAKVMQPDGGKP